MAEGSPLGQQTADDSRGAGAPGSGFADSQTTPGPPGSWSHTRFAVMNCVEVSGDGRSLLFLCLLGCPQGESPFAEMTPISLSWMSIYKSLAWTLCRLNAHLVGQGENSVWNSQTCFHFHRALRRFTTRQAVCPGDSATCKGGAESRPIESTQRPHQKRANVPSRRVCLLLLGTSFPSAQ